MLMTDNSAKSARPGWHDHRDRDGIRPWSWAPLLASCSSASLGSRPPCAAALIGGTVGRPRDDPGAPSSEGARATPRTADMEDVTHLAGQCPRCGKALTPDAPEGLCAACLLAAGTGALTYSTTDDAPTVLSAFGDSARRRRRQPAADRRTVVGPVSHRPPARQGRHGRGLRGGTHARPGAGSR